MKRRLVWSVVLGGPAAFLLWFFRDPERAVPPGPGLVVSPADGLVTAVEHVAGRESNVRISIRLSLFDVHVTRAPITGRIASIDYRPGHFRNAYNPASSAENEQNRVRIDGERYPVTLVQIAGLVARRIVFRLQTGDMVQRGQRVGMIRFGSRVDLHLPDDLTIVVAVGDRVYGGASVVAREVA